MTFGHFCELAQVAHAAMVPICCGPPVARQQRARTEPVPVPAVAVLLRPASVTASLPDGLLTRIAQGARCGVLWALVTIMYHPAWRGLLGV